MGDAPLETWTAQLAGYEHQDGQEEQKGFERKYSPIRDVSPKIVCEHAESVKLAAEGVEDHSTLLIERIHKDVGDPADEKGNAEHRSETRCESERNNSEEKWRVEHGGRVGFLERAPERAPPDERG